MLPRVARAILRKESTLVWKKWTHNSGAKLLSFIAACVLWVYATSVKDNTEEHVFPIRYEKMPPGLTSVEKLPEEVKLRVDSRGKFLGWRLRHAHLKVDLSGSQIGENRIWVSEATFPIDPPNMVMTTSAVIRITIAATTMVRVMFIRSP